ncbi:MAG: hypothetical protein ACREUW_06385 [Burkholderiales bacterium]
MKLTSIILAVAGALTLAACASIDVNTIPFVGVQTFPPSNPAQVTILRAAPTRPHIRLGEISATVSIDPAPPIADIEAKIREQAAALGADAAVIVVDRVQAIGVMAAGPWWGQNVDTITGRKLIAVAIKYR